MVIVYLAKTFNTLSALGLTGPDVVNNVRGKCLKDKHSKMH